MQIRMDPKTYAEHWGKESSVFESNGVYKRLSEITPQENVLEIGAGIGLGTLVLAASRKVLALDNNVHLVDLVRTRLAAAGANAEILFSDVFEPPTESVDAIKAFAPKVIGGWFLGSNADDQDKYVTSETPQEERAKKYRENVEDAMLKASICPPSVEWVHFALRGGVIAGVTEAFANQETKADYDKYVFLPNGFEVVDVQMLDWDAAGSSFSYGAAPNPNLLLGQSIPKVVSVLARRKSS